MNTEERQLAEMLHRVTPEPPRRVTVEDVAYRLASEPQREPRSRRGSIWKHRGWTPLLAALSVFAIAGVSAGIATVATSRHGTQTPNDGTPPATAPASGSPSPPAPAQSPPPSWETLRVAGGMWDAKLINRLSFSQGSLTGGGNSLYAVGDGSLVRIDPASGAVLRTTPYSAPAIGRPVVAGNTVWVVWSYGGGGIVLRGYDASTLAQVASVPVSATGGVSSQAQGVLAAGPDGKLYVAAGDTVATVDPASRQVTRRIQLTAGQASSVAVSPDGSKLYVAAGSFQLLVYDLATGTQTLSSSMPASGGSLLATAGGVWGTTGTGMSEWVWFAPGGNLTRSFRVSQGAGSGLASLPSYGGGVVWIGGSHELVCASPATGRAMARTPIPADHSVVEYFDSVTVLSSGHTYALYQDDRARLAGVASLTPPRACSG
ncbi:MAG TPA: PQQ-binding-like beta-propeller repeat protein [Streptosporangiaceae bacterium]|nr:PQQ-binding-like beta-propeller repeat protein [Streptosporangiaceae bacterium]